VGRAKGCGTGARAVRSKWAVWGLVTMSAPDRATGEPPGSVALARQAARDRPPRQRDEVVRRPVQDHAGGEWIEQQEERERQRVQAEALAPQEVGPERAVVVLPRRDERRRGHDEGQQVQRPAEVRQRARQRRESVRL